MFRKRRIDTERISQLSRDVDRNALLLGKLLANQNAGKTTVTDFSEVEFNVFSQLGDDGIIQWLVRKLDIPNHSFIEFGVEDYRESNTRFLMMNDNWRGLVMDASPDNIARIIASEYYWRWDLEAKTAFVTMDNINELIASSGFEGEIGLLHIDVDGVDFWIWQAIEVANPVIVLVEYNAIFGTERAITVPYKEDFDRTREHYSNLYFGASLRALCGVSRQKGYRFIGSNSAGNNAYFVREDKLNEWVCEVAVTDGYREPRFRQSRDRQGALTYLDRERSAEVLRGLPVHNIETGEIEAF